MDKDCPFLDGDYAAFGKITDGIDVIHKIARSPRDSMDKPLEPVVIKTITVEE